MTETCRAEDTVAAVGLSTPSRRLQLAVKRLLDIAFAIMALILLSPLVAMLAFLIHLESPGPMALAQRRLGRWGRVFVMYKLRTMVDGAPMVLNADGSTRVVDNDPRVTRLGAKLRPLGLDELPQLVNVLKGEMSLIGPRPDHDFQLPYYTERDYHKLAMRPGITSLAQVSGRNALPWRERMALEIEYVERFSLWLDVQIAWRTVGVVLRGDGVNNPTASTEVDR
jgi:undecaprenyl phosphate N,N'-diacetylbacillosamine 1-phosphate transferase